jgi:hypothetical protein
VTWFRVDDTFSTHPKVLRAGNAALGLWARAGSWSAAQLTDGFVPTDMVAVLGGRKSDVAKLIDVGLWEPVHGGYKFHQWEQYQPTRKQVEADRAAWRERQRKARERKERPGDEQ